MKKSASTPSLSSLSAPGAVSAICTGRTSLSLLPSPLKPVHRVKSNSALASMEFQVTDFSSHIQLEAITRSTAYNTGICLAEYGKNVVEMDITSKEVFPNSLLNPSSKDVQLKSFLTCMITPHETVEEIEIEDEETQTRAARDIARGSNRRRRSMDMHTTNDDAEIEYDMRARVPRMIW